MSECEIAGVVEGARLEIYPAVTEAMRSAGSHDDRLDARHVTQAARLAVAGWVSAVEDDDTALTAMAEPEAGHWLMHPVRKNWQVAPGPTVTQIRIWELEAGADPPRLSLSFQFTGHRQFAGPSQANPGQADPDAAETVFAGLLTLMLQEQAPGRGGWFPATSRHSMSSSATRSPAARRLPANTRSARARSSRRRPPSRPGDFG
jgi:hypothetical protein